MTPSPSVPFECLAAGDSPRRRGVPTKALVVFSTWTVVGMFDVGRSTMQRFAGVGRALRPEDYALAFESVWLWAAFTPLIFALAERFPFERTTWARRLGLHAFFAVTVAALDVACDQLLVPLVAPNATAPFAQRFLAESFLNLYSYFAVLGVGLALRWNRLYHERELRVARLETELLQAKLDALEMQLRPHFLYNALHTISGLVRTGQSAVAVRVIADLGDLLRNVLRRDATHEVPLARELALVLGYLSIEQVRFGGRLRVTFDVPETIQQARVPHFLLQPLVENAVRHGLDASAENCEVVIRATKDGDALVLDVEDSGGGETRRGGAGIGLGATRQRLAHLYGTAQSLDLGATHDGGMRARIVIPFHEARIEAAAR